MNNTSSMTSSSSDCSTQTTPYDWIVREDGSTATPSDIMKDMVDKLFAFVSSQTVDNNTIPVDSLGASNDANNLDASNEKLISLSDLKCLKNQLELTMKSIQPKSELDVNSPKVQSVNDYWSRRLKQSIDLLQNKIVKEECK